MSQQAVVKDESTKIPAVTLRAIPPGPLHLVQVVQRQRPTGPRMSLSVRFGTNGQPRFVMAFSSDEEIGRDSEPKAPQKLIDHFEESADQIIQLIEQTCKLEDRLKTKLRFAALGDMSRLLNELRELQEKYADQPLGKQEQIVAVMNELSVLNRLLSKGVDRQDSLFNRVLIGNLTAAQLQAVVRLQFGEHLDRWGFDIPQEHRARIIEVMLDQSQQHLATKVRWTSAECASLLQSASRDELETLLTASQLKSLDLFARVQSR
jgi:hypothetical protein